MNAPDKTALGRILTAFGVGEEEVGLTGARNCDYRKKTKGFFDDGEGIGDLIQEVRF